MFYTTLYNTMLQYAKSDKKHQLYLYYEWEIDIR